MNFTINQIAEVLEGEIEGNSDITLNSLSKIEEGGEGSLTFLSNPKYTNFVYTTKASAIIVSKTFKLDKKIGPTLIRVEDPYKSFAKLLAFYQESKVSKVGIEQPSTINDSAKIGSDLYLGAYSYIGDNVVIGDNVKIYPQVYIGDNVSIGDNTILYSGAKIYYDCVIGNNCIIHSNAVIGADGFGFAPNKDGSYSKIPQIGNAVIEDNVEIGSCTAVDRATMGSTIIKQGVKLDNLVQIAHNVEVGENTVIASQSGIAGSTKIGEGSMIGGQVAVAGHLKLGKKIILHARTGISKNIKDNSNISGYPAVESSKWRRIQVIIKQLPDLLNRISIIEKSINSKTQ
ncbi:MAG: UDP-3-O-(3-hydroxymyristoyl)glucosamine N-acyltransferase [Flavobacteriaceae bacterium]|nr:UDP-3-O-(3-hydroxymyristoyl)glucosamine N-acyltransferase [Flavobacteriaceae bacterium]